MNRLHSLWQGLRKDRFVRNIGWMGSSELLIRVSRLVTTVILARFLSETDYGLAAIVLTIHQFIYVFTRNGIADRIVQVEQEKVEELCRTAFSLNWLVALTLFLIQCLVSFGAAWFYHNANLIWPICLIGLTYLIYPLAMVQTALIRRENRLKILALILSVQVTVDNILTGILALMGLGMWAIVLPKFLVAPIWVILTYKYHPWRMRFPLTFHNWQNITGFGSRILGVELLSTLRENIDYLIVGRLAGVNALGVYYFAFNAGLGISLSVINAIRTSLFSDLCDIRTDPHRFRQQFFKSLRTIAVLIVPLVILQSTLAPIYVPLVFGAKWVERGAVPILILICLSALSRPFADAASLTFRALGQPQIELSWNLIFTLILAINIWIGTTGYGVLGTATAVLATHLILQPIYTTWASRRILPQSP